MPQNNGQTRDRDDLEDLKGRVALSIVFESCGVPVHRVGKNVLARCPFHSPDTHPSLSINGRLWKCFGCHADGDALSFLQLKENLTFPQAVKRLRQLAGRPADNGVADHGANGQVRSRPAPPAVDDAADADDGPRDPDAEDPDFLPGGHTRPELLGQVAAFYAQRLRGSATAKDYLAARGLADPELWDAFGLGFADGSLLATLPPHGPQREALVRLGVITPQGKEHLYGCIVVPLSHPDCGIVGLYGRKTAPHARIPHLYLRGPHRGVLNWEAVKRAPRIVLAESVLDALSLWSAGVRDVTCLYGAGSLHPDLQELLARHATREVHFCLDADRAGATATARLAESLAARGLRVASVPLPQGQDPNQVLVAQGPEALRALAAQAGPLAVTGTAVRATPAVEPLADGFILRCDGVVYQATPQPPFGARLRLLLQAAKDGKRFVDTVDLHAARSRAGFANHAARILGLPKETAEPHLDRLLDAATRWMEAQRDAATRQQALAPPEMTAAEREAALEFLRHPALADRILADMEALGYVGEEKGKLLAYLIGVSRLLEQPLAGIVLSQSGAGKSSLTELVELLVPPEHVILFARLSTLALYFLPRDYLKRKLLILEERAGAEAADYSIRVLLSKKRLTQATVEKDALTGKMATRVYEVEGPIAYLETTTNPRIHPENASRCFEILLDESEAQTARIHEQQRQACTLEGLLARSGSDAIVARHHAAQRLLEPVAVVVPYAHLLVFPRKWLRTRRDHKRFLCLLHASAFLHQHQRVRRTAATAAGERPYVEATLDDYGLAYELAREVLKDTLHELSRSARELLEQAQAFVLQDTRAAETGCFTRRALREHTGWQDYRLREALEELVTLEYLAVLGGSQGRTFEYRLAAPPAAGLLSLSELLTPEELARRWQP